MKVNCFLTKLFIYIIHVSPGVCAYFTPADLTGMLQGPPFIRSQSRALFFPLLHEENLSVSACAQNLMFSGPCCFVTFLTAFSEWQMAATFISTRVILTAYLVTLISSFNVSL